MSYLTPRTIFGDDETRKAWAKECSEARSRQRVYLAVAPRMSITTFDGRRLLAGDELIPARDLQHFKHRDEYGITELAVWKQLERLVGEGIVLMNTSYAPPEGPSAA